MVYNAMRNSTGFQGNIESGFSAELNGDIPGNVVLGVQGPKGDPGPQGIPGVPGKPFTYEDFTPEQLEQLKGDKGDRGDRGDPFTYEDFTSEQLEALKVKGDKGDEGLSVFYSSQDLAAVIGNNYTIHLEFISTNGRTIRNGDLIFCQNGFLYKVTNDFNNLVSYVYADCLQEWRGEKGEKGDRGDPFIYENFTAEQLDALKGSQGDPGLSIYYGPSSSGREEVGETYVIYLENLATNGRKIQIGDLIVLGNGYLYRVVENFNVYVNAVCLMKIKGMDGRNGENGETPIVNTFPLNDHVVIQFLHKDGTLISEAKVYNGEKGDPFTYNDFTPEQLEALRGPKGETGGIDLESASVGQFPVIVSVDENGVPTAWRAADRTHGVDYEEILAETKLTGIDPEYGVLLSKQLNLIVGQEYTVRWNGTDYVCTAFAFGDVISLGNIGGAGADFPISSEPFAIAETLNRVDVYATDGSTEATISIYHNAVKKLDNKYLNLDWIPSKDGTEILREQVVVNSRVDAVDSAYLVNDTPIIVYINGIPHESKIVVNDYDCYANVALQDSVTMNGEISFMFRAQATFVFRTAGTISIDGMTVKICLLEYNKIPEGYLPDSLPGGNVDLTGIVKSVNGEKPDAEGNVNLTIPQGGDACYVMVTEFFDGTVQADKTNAELWQAFNDNKAIHCVFMRLDSVGNTTTDPVVLDLISGSETYAQFIKTICVEGIALTWKVDIRDDVASVMQEITPVLVSVNGKTADDYGNIEIPIPTDEHINSLIDTKLEDLPGSGGNVDQSGGLSGTAKTLLINILRNAIYSTDQSANITLLETELSSGGGSSGGGNTVLYSITNNLTNVTNSNTAVTVAENGMYIATLTASEGYAIDSVTITMGGVDVTATVYSGGAVTIPSVTGNIIITASAVEAAPESSYIQDGLLHEFTDLTTARTIPGGQSIFNSDDDFTLFASYAGYSVSVVGTRHGNFSSENGNQFAVGTGWNGSVGGQIWLTDSSAWPNIGHTPSNVSADVVYHYCVVKSGNIYTLYFDGETVKNPTMNSNGKQYILDGDLVVNRDSKPIDKILIYNRALSEEEISKNFTAIKQEVGE